jgi:hypothetical protein
MSEFDKFMQEARDEGLIKTDDQRAMEAAKFLKKYCETLDVKGNSCKGCIFDHEKYGARRCALAETVGDWDLEGVEDET